MKSHKRIWVIYAALSVLLFSIVNLSIPMLRLSTMHRYKLDIARAQKEIAKNGIEAIDLEKYPAIVEIKMATNLEEPSFIEGGEFQYVLREIGGLWYRFDYQENQKQQRVWLLYVNGMTGIMVLLGGVFLFYLEKKILKPYARMESMPYELAKGNLTIALQQQKHRYFGKFLWGMDMLREELESQRRKELQLQRDKKSLILSLAHDIKTPLSAIKLCGQALAKDLYSDPQKQKELALQITTYAEDIDAYVKEITTASKEDFLCLEVEVGEFYLGDLLKKTKTFYEDRLQLLDIPFHVMETENCLLRGDLDRGIEALQNLMENAIKYGEGGAISIRTMEDGDYRLVTVENENCSLPVIELPHIFDSFWRGSNVQNAKGNGLGLYIVKQLMLKMEGDVFAKQEQGKMAITLVFKKAGESWNSV